MVEVSLDEAEGRHGDRSNHVGFGDQVSAGLLHQAPEKPARVLPVAILEVEHQRAQCPLVKPDCTGVVIVRRVGQRGG